MKAPKGIPLALQPVWDAVHNDPYNKGGSKWTVTQLIAPPQAVILADRHWNQIKMEQERLAEADPLGHLDRQVYRFDGQVVHSMLERLGWVEPNLLLEKRFFAEVSEVSISGQVDALHLREGLLVDYKRTSTLALSGDSGKRRRLEWEEQLNLLAELARRNGYAVKAVQIVVWYRDWSFGKTRGSFDYPRRRLQVLPFRLWDPQAASVILEQKVNNLLRLEQLDDHELQPCTPADTWETPTHWALKKPGAKRARKRVYDKAAAALELRKGEIVEERRGDRARCTGGAEGVSYCSASPWCHQFRNWKARKP